jgi:hypothetical protein
MPAFACEWPELFRHGQGDDRKASHWRCDLIECQAERRDRHFLRWPDDGLEAGNASRLRCLVLVGKEFIDRRTLAAFR